MAVGILNRTVAVVGVALVAGCDGLPDSFHCNNNVDCVHAGLQGRCEPISVCSFPAVRCPSGWAYGAFDGHTLADQCVLSSGGAGAGGGAGEGGAGVATLVITGPADPVRAGVAPIPTVRVEAHDATGQLATGATGSVTLAFPVGANCEGTFTQAWSGGVALFGDLGCGTQQAGIAITAHAQGFADGTSRTFAVAPPAWTEVGLGLPSVLYDFVVDTRGAIYAMGPSGDLQTSSDQGGSWSQVFVGARGSANSQVLAVAYDGLLDRVYAQTPGGLFAGNAGNWQRLPQSFPGVIDMIARHGTLVMLVDSGVYISTDGGGTFNQWQLAANSWVIDVEDDGSRVYTMTDPVTNCTLFRTPDFGKTTQSLLQNCDVFDVGDQNIAAGQQAIIATTHQGMIISTDDGATFGPMAGAPSEMRWLAHEGTLITATDRFRTAYMTDMAANGYWQPNNPPTQVDDSHINYALANGTLYAAGHNLSTFYELGVLSQWTNPQPIQLVGGVPQAFIARAPADYELWVDLTRDGFKPFDGTYASTNHGQAYDLVANAGLYDVQPDLAGMGIIGWSAPMGARQIEGAKDGNSTPSPLDMMPGEASFEQERLPDGTVVDLLVASDVWMSTDGTSWTDLGSPVTNGTVGLAAVGSKDIFVASMNMVDGFYYHDNAGWHAVTGAGHTISAFAYAGSAGVYAGSESGLYHSDDGAPPWSPVGTFNDVTNIAVDPDQPARMFIALLGSPPVLKVTVDGGIHWTECVPGPPAVIKQMLVTSGGGGDLFVATDQGTYRTTTGCQ
jgi:hypothetical protein